MSDMLLSVRNMRVAYGGVEAVCGVSIEARRGSIVTVIGANGAGKTTLLNAIMGVLPASGDVAFDGADVERTPLEARVARGLCLVPERRELFSNMSVGDNLELGGFRRTAAERAETRRSAAPRPLPPATSGRWRSSRISPRPTTISATPGRSGGRPDRPRPATCAPWPCVPTIPRPGTISAISIRNSAASPRRLRPSRRRWPCVRIIRRRVSASPWPSCR